MISIITPVYNGEKFIESCLKVVIDQNCPNMEHIIIDGGSKDSTVEIIKQYADKYSHIHWISEPDKGQSDAMNKGISMAKAEIIGILNVDDFYEPNVLNRVLEIFQKLSQPSLVVANCNIWDHQGKLKEINKPKNLKITDLLLGWTFAPPPVNPSAYFYHKSLHDKIGLYDVNEHYAMDIDFLLRAVPAARVQYIDETWGNFRYLEGTKSFEDFKANQAEKRYNNMLNTYRKKLPFTLQIYLSILVRIKYFLRHPQDLIPSIMKRIKFKL